MKIKTLKLSEPLKAITMNEIKIFNNPQFGEIRTALNEEGEPLFCLTDVCRILDLQTNKVKERLNEKGWNTIPYLTNGGIQNVIFINESNLYKTIFQSRKPVAENLTNWVSSDVLPSIRKHGAYLTNEAIEKVLTSPDTIIRLANTIKEERQQKELAQKQLALQAPIIKYANEVLSSTTGHTPTQIASELNMSAETLNLMLVAAKIIRKTGNGEYSLTSTHQGKNYAIPVTAKFEHKNGTSGTKISLHYTESGRKMIHEVFERAKNAGVIYERKGRYFYNSQWNIKKEEAA